MAAYENWKFEIALHSQPDDPFPVFDTDLTGYVDGVLTGGHGRPSELQSVDPGTLSLVLNNADHRFTLGNTISPYYPYWKHARRLRVRDTIGYRTFDIFNGYLELPDINDWAESGSDQVVAVTAVDRLTRLDRSRKLKGVIAEHVLLNGGAALWAYWPMTEVAGPTYRTISPTARADLVETLVVSTDPSIDPNLNQYAPASATIAADDTPVPNFGPQMKLFSGTYSPILETQLKASSFGSYAVPANATVSVVLWVSPSTTSSLDGQWKPIDLAFGTGLGGGFIRIRRTNSTEAPGAVWKASFTDDLGAAWTSNAYGPYSATKPTLLACRISLSTNAMSLFVDGTEYLATVTGTMPSTINLLNASVGNAFTGGLGHLQVYISSGSSDYTLASQRAQLAVGMFGLAGQTTGQRLTTVASYAGIPAGDLLIGAGASFMSKARLAGASAFSAMKIAETTEQGALFADGAGRLVFLDRVRRNNI